MKGTLLFLGLSAIAYYIIDAVDNYEPPATEGLVYSYNGGELHQVISPFSQSLNRDVFEWRTANEQVDHLIFKGLQPSNFTESDKKAIQKGFEIYSKYTPKCGDYYYTRYDYGRHPATAMSEIAVWQVTFKGTDKTDKLNGIEWRGRFDFSLAPPVRTYMESSGKWGSWSRIPYDGSLSDAVLSGGEFKANASALDKMYVVSCEAIPEG